MATGFLMRPDRSTSPARRPRDVENAADGTREGTADPPSETEPGAALEDERVDFIAVAVDVNELAADQLVADGLHGRHRGLAPQ
jgi:hypothetical protein